MQTEQVGRKPRKPQAETKTEQGPFGVLGKHESEGTPHQAIDVSAPPVSVGEKGSWRRWEGKGEMEIGQIGERLSNEIITWA